MAAEAERIGLVNRVVPAADLDREATAFTDVSPPARRLQSEEHQEALAALREKRLPGFKDR